MRLPIHLSIFLGGCTIGLDYAAKDTGADWELWDTAGSPSDTPPDSPPSDSAETDEPQRPGLVTDMLPSYGSTSGGTIVRFLGGPFPESTQIFFNGVPAPLSSNNGTIVQVLAPPAVSEGPVDILVQTSAEEEVLSGAFQYFADASGLAGAIGSVRHTTLMGGYWIDAAGSPAVLDEVSALLTFVQPVDFRWWEFYTPEMDSCSIDETHPPPAGLSLFEMGEGSVTLQRSDASIPLSWNSTENFYASDVLSSAEVFANAAYDLAPFTGSLFGFSVPQFVTTSQETAVSSPALQGPSAPGISQNQTFTWSSSGASWIRLGLSLLNESGTEYEQSISCIFQDTGTFTVDGSLFSAWPVGRQMDVYFGRVVEQTALLPHNNSESRIVGEYMMIGAALTQ